MENTKSRGGKRLNAGRKPFEKESDKKRTRSIMLTDEEYANLSMIAKEKGVTRSVLIAEWIKENSPNK